MKAYLEKKVARARESMRKYVRRRPERFSGKFGLLRLFRLLRFWRKRLAPGGSKIQIRFQDRSFELDTGTAALHMRDALSADGSYEAWVLKYLKLASDFFGPAKDAVDIGANAGIITVVLATLQHEGRVLAFEALSLLCDRLASNLEKNKITNVIVERAIVDDQHGATRRIEIPEGSLGGASVAGGLDKSHSVVHGESVPTRRLDDYLREEHPDLDIKIIKIDVEHWELPVLAGAARTIREHDPVLLIEFNVQHRTPDVERYGYELYAKLSGLFAHVFRIDRLSHELLPVRSYAELRGAMLTGHFVEDLLCFNSPDFLKFLRPQIAAPRFPSYHATRLAIRRDGRSPMVSLSHYPDDWCHGHDFFLYAQASEQAGGRVRLRFANEGPKDSVLLLIANGDQLTEVQLGREAVTREYDLSGDGDAFIYIFIEHSFSASRFFFNDDDPRELGVRIAIQEL